MPLLIDREPLARDLAIGVFLLSFTAEIAATYFGRLRDESPGRLGLLRGSVVEVATLGRRVEAPVASDRGTKRVVITAVWGGLLVAFVIAKNVPGPGADTWTTLALGVGIAVVGVALRSWAVFTLGTHFRRQVTVEARQEVNREGPYRWLRHPSYAGTLVTVFGLSLAFGSWIGAVVALAISVAGHLPRIRVEEEELRAGLGERYTAYAETTARIVPGIW